MIEPIEIYPQPDPCCERACPETKPNYAAEAEAAANEAAAASVIAKEWAEKAEDTYELFIDYAYSKDETYNRNEVDDLLADKADITELNNYYDKTETDTLLAAKADASDLDDYYTKTAADTLLAAKADVSDLDDYYDKTEIDDLLADKADVDSPALTGTPTAPTAAALNKTTQIATDAFVYNALDLMNNAARLLSITEIPISSLTNGSPYSGYGNCNYYKKDTEVHIHLGIQGLTSGNDTIVYTMPSGYRPNRTKTAVGIGANNSQFAVALINPNGIITIRSQGAYAMIDLVYNATQ